MRRARSTQVKDALASKALIGNGSDNPSVAMAKCGGKQTGPLDDPSAGIFEANVFVRCCQNDDVPRVAR